MSFFLSFSLSLILSCFLSHTFSLILSENNDNFSYSRYTTGLEKLEFAAGQVSIMQENLQSLQPKLKKTSDETEEIMIIIERETADAEKKKEVVGADESAANEAAATSQVS